jgi:hypothetical protein
MKWLEKSPAHFKAWKEGRLGESSPAMELGIAIHSAVLEPDKFRDTYVALPDTSHLASPGQKAAMTKAAKKELAGSGKIALSFSDYNLVLNIFESVLVLSLSKGWRILTPNILSKNPSVNKLSPGMIKTQALNVNIVQTYMRDRGVLSDLKSFWLLPNLNLTLNPLNHLIICRVLMFQFPNIHSLLHG